MPRSLVGRILDGRLSAAEALQIDQLAREVKPMSPQRAHGLNLGLAIGFALMSIVAGVLLNICIWQEVRIQSAELRLSRQLQAAEIARAEREAEMNRARDVEAARLENQLAARR